MIDELKAWVEENNLDVICVDRTKLKGKLRYIFKTYGFSKMVADKVYAAIDKSTVKINEEKMEKENANTME